MLAYFCRYIVGYQRRNITKLSGGICPRRNFVSFSEHENKMADTSMDPRAEKSPFLSSNLKQHRSAEEILKEIKNWMQSDGNESKKNYENLVKHIELTIGRQFTCLETTWVERQYVNAVLDTWMQKKFHKAFDYLENKTTYFSTEMSTFLSELDSIDSFDDIHSKLTDNSRLRYWCDGGCQYLQLILDQKDLFKTTPRFVVLVANYFKHFKKSCTEKVLFSRCLNEFAMDKTRGEKCLKFISELDVFLTHLREDKDLQDILERGFLIQSKPSLSMSKSLIVP